MMQCWIDGEVKAAKDAQLSVLDHGLLYGDGVFEGIRCVAGKVVDLALHLDRFEASARAIYLEVQPRERSQTAVLATLRALGKSDAYVRLVLTRGSGPLGVDVAGCNQPRLFCIAGDLTLYQPKAAGVALVTVSLRRPDPDMLDPRVKSLNYLNNVLAKIEAKRCGGDEALLLNRRGTIAEASGANLFARLDGVLCTPPASDGALSGITRRRVLHLGRELGVEVREQSLTRHDVLCSELTFLTGTGAGIVPVASLDGVALRSDAEFIRNLKDEAAAYALAHGTPF